MQQGPVLGDEQEEEPVDEAEQLAVVAVAQPFEGAGARSRLRMPPGRDPALPCPQIHVMTPSHLSIGDLLYLRGVVVIATRPERFRLGLVMETTASRATHTIRP